MPTTDTELAQASALLAKLLEEAQNSTSQDAGPVILYKSDLDLGKMTNVRVISPDWPYYKNAEGGWKYDETELIGHELIRRLINEGYKVCLVMIIRRAMSRTPTTQHEVKVILVKLWE